MTHATGRWQQQRNVWTAKDLLAQGQPTRRRCSSHALVSRRPDTYVNTYSTGFPFRISEDYFSEEEIPDQIKRAQIELAVYLHNNTDGISLSGLNDFKNVKIGSLDVTPDKTGAVGADHVPPMFERYLTGLRISGPGNIAIKRS